MRLSFSLEDDSTGISQLRAGVSLSHGFYLTYKSVREIWKRRREILRKATVDY